jgi:hypothetical protein
MRNVSLFLLLWIATLTVACSNAPAPTPPPARADPTRG